MCISPVRELFSSRDWRSSPSPFGTLTEMQYFHPECFSASVLTQKRQPTVQLDNPRVTNLIQFKNVLIPD